GSVDGAAYLPFPWPGADALFFFPPFDGLRVAHGYGAEPESPAVHEAALDAAVDRCLSTGDHLGGVFHPFILLEQAERWAVLDRFVGRVTDDERLWVAPMREVAAFVRERPDRFAGRAELDERSWM